MPEKPKKQVLAGVKKSLPNPGKPTGPKKEQKREKTTGFFGADTAKEKPPAVKPKPKPPVEPGPAQS